MFSIKKQKKNKKKRGSVLDSFRLSHQWFFGSVLSFSIFFAVLLFGACMRADMGTASIVMPDRKKILEKNIEEVVRGYPIQTMAPYIANHDKVTASFLVGIAKKESNWGKRVPVDTQGNDCFNYWGYRGAGSRGIEMGHGCFGSPEEAIGIVGGRIDTFVREYHFDTPEELIVWKCGFSCEGHSSQSVKKWISDVGIYARKVR